jgi:hypothetical protein
MCHERENNKCLHIQEYYMYMYMLFILGYGLLRHVQHCFSYIAISVLLVKINLVKRRVWRYQRGNQNPYIEEEHTTQWPKEKVQKDKQWYTKHTHRTKNRVTPTPLKTGGELIVNDM